MSAFDISQYTIEVSMDNAESTTNTSETDKLYPTLETEQSQEGSNSKRVTFEDNEQEESAVHLQKEEAKEEVVFVQKQIASIEGNVIYAVEPAFGVTLSKQDAVIDLPAPTKRRIRKKVKKVESEEKELPVVSQPEKIVAAIPDELMFRARKAVEAQAEVAEERRLVFSKRIQAAADKEEVKSQKTKLSDVPPSTEMAVEQCDQTSIEQASTEKHQNKDTILQEEIQNIEKQMPNDPVKTEPEEPSSATQPIQDNAKATTCIEVSVKLDTVSKAEPETLIENIDEQEEQEGLKSSEAEIDDRNQHEEQNKQENEEVAPEEQETYVGERVDITEKEDRLQQDDYLRIEQEQPVQLNTTPPEDSVEHVIETKLELSTESNQDNENDSGERKVNKVQEDADKSVIEVPVETYSEPGPELVHEEEEISFERDAEIIESVLPQQSQQEDVPETVEETETIAEEDKESEQQSLEDEASVEFIQKEQSPEDSAEISQDELEKKAHGDDEKDKLIYTAPSVRLYPSICDLPEEDSQSQTSVDKDEIISIKENIISINISPSPRVETARSFFDNSEADTSSHAIQDDIISLEEVADSLPEDTASIKTFTIPEPMEDGEPWNRWLFTQLRYIWENYSDKIAIVSLYIKRKTPNFYVEEVGETRCISYGELMDGVMRTANYLQHHGVGEETVVGFCMESTFEFLLYELACFFLGALPVIFRPSHIVSDHVTPLNLKVMITDAEHYGHVLRSHAFFGELQQVFVLTDDIRTLYLPRNVWTYDGLGFLDFNCDLRLQLGKSPRTVVAFSTSGTASSRGKVVGHSAQSSKAICTHYYTELISLLKEKHPEQKADVHLVTTGLHTIDGFSYAIYSLIHGGTLILTEANADVWKVSFLDRVAGLIERYKIPMLMVHSQFLKCFSKYEIHKIYNTDSLKLLCHFGSCLPSSVIENVRELGMSTTQAYITTETGAFSLEDVTSTNVLISTSGEPFVGNNVKILELEGDNEVAPGKWGRLWIQGPTLFSEYLCEAKFAERCSSGWFFTGDIASLDEQARLYVAGPMEGVVKGANDLVPLVEAEIILSDLPSIDDIAITKLKDEIVAGIVLVEGDIPPSVNEINCILKERGLKLKIDRLTVFDFIPRSETGKLIRGDLPFLFEIEPETEIETEAELDIAADIPEENESSL